MTLSRLWESKRALDSFGRDADHRNGQIGREGIPLEPVEGQQVLTHDLLLGQIAGGNAGGGIFSEQYGASAGPYQEPVKG